MRKKWTRTEKLLFIIPLLFIVMANWTFLGPRLLANNRTFRSDMLVEVVFPRTHCEDASWRCGVNLKQVGIGLMQYVQDYDEKLPAAKKGVGSGWGTALWPYLKSSTVFHCPLVSHVRRTPPVFTTDFYFNSRLQSSALTQISDAKRNILLGEGNDGVEVNDSAYAKSELPPEWRTATKSPARRHLTHQVWAVGRANYLFVDGHVKALPPETIAIRAYANNYFFQPQKH